LSAQQDPVRRAQYDLEEQAGSPATACDVDLDDLRVEVSASPAGPYHCYEHDCRCGDVVRFTDGELLLGAGSLVLSCPSCSLFIHVLYEKNNKR